MEADRRSAPMEREQHEAYGQQAGHADSKPVDVNSVDDVLRATMQRLWEAVRYGADVIVTLRQENSILQSQLSSLKHSENDLQTRIDELLERIAALESANANTPSAGVSPLSGPGNIDRVEDLQLTQRLADLEGELTEALEARSDAEERLRAAEAALAETAAQLAQNQEISQQVLQLRSELETRSLLLNDVIPNYFDATDTDVARRVHELEEQLEEANRIIALYRAAGLRHLENPTSRNQLSMFLEEASSVPSIGEVADLNAVATRLEAIARQLDELAGLS